MINSELKLPCGAILKNRIAKSAMSENMAGAGHIPGKNFGNLYGRWARGGAGLVITGNVMIDRNALGELNNVVVEPGLDNFCELKNWARAGTENSTHLWMQLNHPGKQSPKFICSQPVAPSPIGYESRLKKVFNVPRELKEPEIEQLIQRFAYAAKTAQDTGFTGVQIHGAHGYLVAQFLSPLHNQRVDKWGGSLENRMRFVVEVYREIRKMVGPNFPVGIKLNSADFQRGGFSEEESLEVAKTLSNLGIDLIEISGGTYEAPVMMEGQKASTRAREAYFSDYCAKIRKEIKTPLLLTGGFRTSMGMQQALNSGDCDMVGMARCLALDPDFPQKILRGEKVVSKVKPLSSGSKFFDGLIPLEITWYTQQLARMGKGKDPLPHFPVKISILETLFQFGLDALKRVRI